MAKLYSKVAVKKVSGLAQSDSYGFFEESSPKNMLMKFGVDSVQIRWSWMIWVQFRSIYVHFSVAHFG